MQTNKVRAYAEKVNIKRQVDLRRALEPYGIAEATARDIWLSGASTRKHYGAIRALERVLHMPAEKFLEDADELVP